MNWYLEALKKYAVFSGRARRKEFWYFSLFNLIIYISLAVVDLATGSFNYRAGVGLLSGIYLVTTWLPTIAVTVRRLHDTGRKGWWLLINMVPLIGFIVMFVFMVQDSHQGANQYGSDPKERIRGGIPFPEKQNILASQDQKNDDHAGGKGLDDDGAKERILREADARSVEETLRNLTYPISAERQKDEEFIVLLKSAVNEKRLDTISSEELLRICNRAQSIVAFSNKMDIELSKTINTLSGEIKKRGLSQENKPRVISNYEDSSFTNEDKKPFIVKGLIAFSVAIAIPLILIYSVRIILDYSDKAVVTESNYSPDETVTKTPKMHFDILGYKEKYKGYYGDAPLGEVARDVYERGGFAEKDPDFNSWVKSAGIEPLIQEDIKRRTPSFIDKLSKAVNAVSGVALPFRYGEEYIQGRLYRYDRFTRTVQQKHGTGWLPIPWLKNLQHARDVLAKAAIDRYNKELKDTLETMKFDEQQREMNRQFDEQQREMNRQFDEQQREMNRRNEEYLHRSLIR